MAESTITPTYFVITGFPKSGNKWLQRLVFDCESIGCFAIRDWKGLPLTLRMLLEHQGISDLLRRERVTMQDFTTRMFDANSPVRLKLSERGREELRGLLYELGVQSARVGPGENPERRFAHILDPERKPPYASNPWRAIGMPAMHTPVAELQTLYPDFKIINLLRDPRDVVVSFFYHMMATMNPTLAMTFVSERRGATVPGELETNPRWKLLFGRRMTRRLDEYYGQPALNPANAHRVRYEDLLTNAEHELKKILTFLNTSEEPQAIAAIVQRRSFEAVTGGKDEQRNSLIRKGQSGDWANYFDRELLDALGPSFIKLVRELGYESNDRWTADVPVQAPKAFDFARFRLRRSTTRSFAKYWEQSPELRKRYPDSTHDIEGEDCYFTWLERCPHQEVQDWLTLGRRMEELWQVDIVEKAGL